jgi:riboflavin kinase/FMN adenylyltransferase
LLSDLYERFPVMEAEGIEEVLVLPFSRELAALTPETFVRRFLVDKLRARAVVVGEDFRFGAKQSGGTETLRTLGREHGFSVEVVDPVMWRGLRCSSTNVRQLLLEGGVTRAARLLGSFYGLAGRVVAGHGVGRTQTVPTLNLETEAEILPRHGVYVTRTLDLDSQRRWPSISNIGMRPTFNGDSLAIETYLLGALTPPSPHRIRVEFLHRLRDERKFASPEALKGQILRDVGKAQSWFRRARACKLEVGD